MKGFKSFLSKNRFPLLMLSIYGVASFIFLERFPFMHSDEAWLSGLSQTVLKEGRLDLTEPFFDLYPRNPHAVKLVFVGIQALAINFFGHTLRAARSISLAAALLSLVFFFGILRNRFSSRRYALMFTMLLAVDIQFIYASHFARQEMLLALTSLAAYAYLTQMDPRTPWEYACLAAILSIGIGIHPNSFIVALPFGLILLHRRADGKAGNKGVLSFIAVLAAAALFFVFLSLRLDPDFIKNYTAYGETLGVTENLADKLFQLKFFYLKLFHRVSGTYYTPDIRLQLLLMGAAALFGLLRLIRPKENCFPAYPLLGLAGINLGYFLVGRYNQTSIIFLFPWFYLLLAELLSSARPLRLKILGSLLGVTLAASSCFLISESPGKDYGGYLDKISSLVPQDARVLSNLNTAYYFSPDRLFDYRNLAHLGENGLGFEDYIHKNRIEYILYPEEMDVIWNTRPVYNSLYGNLSGYYESMQTFFDDSCRLEGILPDGDYPMRIVRFMGQKEWTLRVYKVLP